MRRARGQRPANVDEKLEDLRGRGHHGDDERPPSRDRSPHYGGLRQRPLVAEKYQAKVKVIRPDQYRAAERLAAEAERLNALSAHTTAAFLNFAATDWITEDLAEIPERATPAELGATASAEDITAWMDDTLPWPDGAPSADDRWHRDGVIAKESGRVPNMRTPAPRFARPGDASVLRHLYVQRATGLQVARTELPVPPDATIDDDTTWADPSRAPITADLRARLARAVPFWLPPGETAAFASSEPLDDESVADIALPYPDILVVPAEPMVLEPVESDEAVAADLDRLDRFLARTRSTDDYGEPSQREWQVDAGDALRVRGGLVEAILVRCGRNGGLADPFAWCIAVPHSHARFGVLGRVVVPAFLSRTVHADTVRQLAAAVAWADWRAPTETVPVKAIAAVMETAASRNGTVGGVHVLDATRTNSRSASDGPGDGPSVRPHLRRGHWKRVRVGTRADWESHRTYRRVRIAAVVVNAGQAVPFSAQVYRLRPSLPTRPASGN